MSLRDRVLAISGQDVYSCIQCGMCSSTCQSLGLDGFRPERLVHLVQLDRWEVVEKRMFDTCLYCYLCSVRCPRELSIPEIAVALSNIYVEMYGAPKPEKAFLKELERNGFVNPVRLSLSALGVAGSLKAVGLKGLKLAPLILERGRVKDELKREVRRIVKG